MKIVDLPQEIIDYGVKLINPVKLWNTTKGENIKVAILDTGIDPNHIDLKNNVKGGVNFTTGLKNDFYDRVGHGTFCAGLIAAEANKCGVIGMAPKASIYAVKVLDDSSRGNLSWLLQGLQWCIDNNMDVINMSLGFHKDYPKLHDLICEAYKKNIICVAAVGNNKFLTDAEYPARYPEVIGISAIDDKKHIAKFSTTGKNIGLAAPGVNIISTYPKNRYAQGSGTSFSCPLISGAIALILAQYYKANNRKMTNAELREFIYAHCEDLGPVGRDILYGYGLLKLDS